MWPFHPPTSFNSEEDPCHLLCQPSILTLLEPADSQYWKSGRLLVVAGRDASYSLLVWITLAKFVCVDCHPPITLMVCPASRGVFQEDHLSGVAVFVFLGGMAQTEVLLRMLTFPFLVD